MNMKSIEKMPPPNLEPAVLSQSISLPVQVMDPKANRRLPFDAKFNVSQVTDALGRTTKYQHDSNGNATSVTDAGNQTTQIGYLISGDPVQAFAAGGGGSSPSAAPGGSCGGGGTQGSVGIQPPNLQPVVLSQPISLPVKVTDPKGNATSFSYDAKYNLIQVQDAQANGTQFSYDAQGHMTAVKDALGGVMSKTYSGNGDLVGVTDALGRTDLMTHDSLGRVALNTDPLGDQTGFAYDLAGHTTQVKDALNGATNVAYQAGRRGRLPASITDAKNHATAFGYDVLGRVTSVKNALNQSASIIYDIKSRPQSVTNRNGQTFTFAYDSLDRLTTLTAPEGSINLGYDAVGNLTSAVHYNGSAFALSYDALNRATSVGETLPNGFSVTLGYAYDANGNRTRMTTPWGSFSYTYDTLNRVTSVLNPAGQTVAFAYDALGRRTKMTYPNGVATSYAYDAAGQVTQIVHQKIASQSAIAFDNYTYDAAGDRTAIVDSHGSHGFAYDALHRLTAAGHPGTSTLPVLAETFAYDAISNRASDALRTGYTYDAANRLVSDSSFTYTSDANGNVTSRTSRASGQTTAYVYDSGNHRVQVNGPLGTIATYKLDAAGNRVEKNAGGTITRYVYDGKNVLAILDANNNLLQLFTNGPGIASPLIARINGTDYFYHADALGSITALTDINGNVVETYEYQAFGKAVVKDALGNSYAKSTVGNPLMYASSIYDPETEQDHMGFRDYNMETGRFTQEDPIGFSGGNMNFYSYADSVGELPDVNLYA